MTRGRDAVTPAARRYEAAIALIKATDIYRTLTRAGRATTEDAESVSRARHMFEGKVPPRARRGTTYRGTHRAQ